MKEGFVLSEKCEAHSHRLANWVTECASSQAARVGRQLNFG